MVNISNSNQSEFSTGESW